MAVIIIQRVWWIAQVNILLINDLFLTINCPFAGGVFW